MNPKQIQIMNSRLDELMTPIQKQIMMCNDPQELILLSFGLMNKAKSILDVHLGEDRRKLLFNEHA
jgi:hypothetical protein